MMEGGDEISLDGEEELEDGALSHVTNTRIVKLEAREEAPLKNNMVKVILKIFNKWLKAKPHTAMARKR